MKQKNKTNKQKGHRTKPLKRTRHNKEKEQNKTGKQINKQDRDTIWKLEKRKSMETNRTNDQSEKEKRQ